MRLKTIRALVFARMSVVCLFVSFGAAAHSDNIYPPLDVSAAGYNWFPPLADAPIEIQIDKSARRLLVSQGNRIVGMSIVSIGAEGRPTPVGTFSITRKVKSHVSKQFQGVRMPYSIFIGADGYAIHAGDLASPSAGCIRIPLYFAETLFQYIKIGDTVRIVEGKEQ